MAIFEQCVSENDESYYGLIFTIIMNNLSNFIQKLSKSKFISTHNRLQDMKIF
jgi:hypothetical protein